MFTVFRTVKNCVLPQPFRKIISYTKNGKKLKSNDERKAELQSQLFNLVQKYIKTALKNRKSLSVDEYRTVVAEMKGNNELISMFRYENDDAFKKPIFDVLFKLRPPNDSMENAKNFMKAFDIKIDLGIERTMIQLYAKKASEMELTKAEEQDLIRLCDKFIADELHLLSEINVVVVAGLCATKDWKKAFDLPSLSYKSLNVLTRKSLRENDIDLAWTILNRLTQLPKHYQILSGKTISTFAKYFKRTAKEIPENAEKLFSLCEQLKMVLIEPNVIELKDALAIYGHQVELTNIDFSGICNVCKNNLNSVGFMKKEFTVLRNEFLNNVVKGNDIYQKTTPHEWQCFVEMIETHGPFDYVIDGLNVAYGANSGNSSAAPYGKLNYSNHKQKPCAYSLANAVQQLTKGKRVLVIGRKHMNKWPRINYIREIAHVFLVDDISKDDIFLLYAAIHSGQNCCIISNDYMRQHKFVMGKKYNELFKVWQQEHWYGVTLNRNKSIELVKPMQYQMHIHKVADYWHVPFRTNEDLASKTWNHYELPKNWACIRIKEKSQLIYSSNES